jgi:branched-subunit amino acid transport protein
MTVRYIIINIAVMAFVTYLIRMLPLVLINKKIKNRFVRSFLYYIPYAVLAAMTIPAIFYSTDNIVSAVAGFVLALILALFDKPLLVVAVVSSAGVYAVELLMKYL